MRKSSEKLLAALVAAHDKYTVFLDQCQADAPAIFREVRAKTGLRQQDVADRLGVTSVYLSRVENGHLVAGYATLAALYRVIEEEK